MSDSVAHLPPSRRKRLVKQSKVRPREIRVCGVVLREEPLFSPKLHLEKDTFSGGYNVTVRDRNARRRAEWHGQNDRVVKIEAHTDALGYRHPMMILVPPHLWKRIADATRELTNPPKSQWYTWSAESMMLLGASWRRPIERLSHGDMARGTGGTGDTRK